MNKASLIADAMRLPRDERIQLGEDLWNSVIDDEQSMPTPDELAEARRRLEEHRRDLSAAVAAEGVLARLRSRFG